MRGKWLTVFAASVVLLVSCGPNLAARQRMVTRVNGMDVDLGALGGGCGSIGIGTRPTQADIDVCKANLDPTAGEQLQILWAIFKNVRTDAMPHDLDDCPILTLYPLQQGYKNGTITPADFAKKLYKFYVAKYNHNREGKQAEAKAALIAAGLPLP